MRVSGHLFFAILFATIIFVPLASADNANISPNTTSFITIDPVGDHRVGDVFFINGTTNLLISDDQKLFFGIVYDEFTPAGTRFLIEESPKIFSGINGTNQWSVNVTDFAGTYEGKMIIFVSAIDVGTGHFIDVEQSFAILPHITIDPIGDHAIGDVFFINGTTDIPVTENLTMNINSVYRHATKNSPPFPYQEIQINNISIISKKTPQQDTNWWSVNISDNVKELRSDYYRVLVVSLKDNITALMQSSKLPITSFHLLPAKNVTALTTLKSTTGHPISPPTPQYSPLPFELPIIMFAAIAGLRQIFGEKHE